MIDPCIEFFEGFTGNQGVTVINRRTHKNKSPELFLGPGFQFKSGFVLGASERESSQRYRDYCICLVLAGMLGWDHAKALLKCDESDSFRIDIPKQMVSRENRRIEGADYFEGDDPKFSDRRPADKLLNEIFTKTGK